MPLREVLHTILTNWPDAKIQPMAGHPIGAFIRLEGAKDVEMALGELGAGFVVEGSAGLGNWAAVPWISVFDPAVTTSATQGYYVVYLFHVNDPLVYLSLNQGTTAVREEFRGRAREILQDRADLMRVGPQMGRGGTGDFVHKQYQLISALRRRNSLRDSKFHSSFPVI